MKLTLVLNAVQMSLQTAVPLLEKQGDLGFDEISSVKALIDPYATMEFQELESELKEKGCPTFVGVNKKDLEFLVTYEEATVRNRVTGSYVKISLNYPPRLISCKGDALKMTIFLPLLLFSF